MNLANFMTWCEHVDPVLHLPEDLIMTSRVSVMMRGMGLALGIRLSTAPYFVPFAHQLLAEEDNQDTGLND